MARISSSRLNFHSIEWPPLSTERILWLIFVDFRKSKWWWIHSKRIVQISLFHFVCFILSQSPLQRRNSNGHRGELCHAYVCPKTGFSSIAKRPNEKPSERWAVNWQILMVAVRARERSFRVDLCSLSFNRRDLVHFRSKMKLPNGSIVIFRTSLDGNRLRSETQNRITAETTKWRNRIAKQKRRRKKSNDDFWKISSAIRQIVFLTRGDLNAKFIGYLGVGANEYRKNIANFDCKHDCFQRSISAQRDTADRWHSNGWRTTRNRYALSRLNRPAACPCASDGHSRSQMYFCHSAIILGKATVDEVTSPHTNRWYFQRDRRLCVRFASQANQPPYWSLNVIDGLNECEPRQTYAHLPMPA